MVEKEISKILDRIEALYFDEDLLNKQKELLELWTRYYQLSFTYHIKSSRAYDLYLLGENVSYVVDASLNYQKNLETPLEIIDRLRNVIHHNKDNNQLEGITLNEANIFLGWLVNRTWKNLSHFGLDLSRNSLNGFCEIAQFSTIYPLEQLGLLVTKNTAENSFDYPFHHAFGTVLIPIDDNGVVTNQPFLIDATYKQFFTAVRCNHGRYYAPEENTGMIVAPDPGYFMKTNEEKVICEKIIQNGYILLTTDVARIYGEGFQKASISLENYHLYDIVSNRNGDYYLDRVYNTSTEYCASLEELEGYAFELDIPSRKILNNK